MGPSFNTHLPRSPSLLAINHAAHSSSASVNPLKRPRSPNMTDDSSNPGSTTNGLDLAGPVVARHQSLLNDLYCRSERMISKLFVNGVEKKHIKVSNNTSNHVAHESTSEQIPAVIRPPKRAARAMDEDDYGDDEEEEEQEKDEHVGSPTSLGNKRQKLSKDANSTDPNTALPDEPPVAPQVIMSSSEQAKSSEEVRKKLEQEKKAKEDSAKESFHSLFYTLENDHDAMLEQQKLDELDRQVETEMSGQGAGNNNSGDTSGSTGQQGTLSSANLGASSLTLKHLIARIDQKRHLVKATDAQLRSLMSEVRKNRSKWASEEKIGQEELYESAERVLMELKAMTEWAAPFLQKVNKRDAPDYYHIIKHPMDIGTMIKKLKQLQYGSKKHFCDDLELIWANCLKYNANPEHFLRKKAEHMRKETSRLTPLIPDIVVRDRAEVEAEERRLQQDFDDGEDSEDEPLMSTRGRKAPGKSSKKGTTTARKAVQTEDDGNPAAIADGKPMIPSINALAMLKGDHLRSDFDSQDESQHGLSTPPPGTLTPLIGSAAPPSHADASEVDGIEPPMNGVASAPVEEVFQESEEYQTWKQVTKKDRARVAAERHRLFQGNRINPDEPAALRTKAGMRRWLRLQRRKERQQAPTQEDGTTDEKTSEENDRGTTLAEGMDVDDESTLPDYWDPLSAIPHIDERIAWVEDSEGNVIEQKAECLRLAPEGQFIAPKSSFSKKIEENMRQMQDTRKIVAKISIVKQMQVQAQTYQNQFQKYDPEPFREADVGPLVISDEGPIMAQKLCRQALQRSIGKLFYHAGFEDCQPSALESITDITTDYFQQMIETLKTYIETPRIFSETTPETALSPAKAPSSTVVANSMRPLEPRFTKEEAVLHTLHHYSHDLDNLDSYVTEDIDRLSSRLEAHHARTRDYLAELLRPALDPAAAGTDGAGAFNDGSDQFVGGDFAEDIDEDFFGFKELGLDKEFGLASLGVPLHLLQSRMHNAHQPAFVASTATSGQLMEEPERYPAVTVENVDNQIGLVRDFFRKKLEANDNEPLIEDDDLPVKQRFPKPRLPPTGKISSPRKRPLREQQMMARKKRRMEIEAEREREREAANAASGSRNGTAAPVDAAPVEIPMSALEAPDASQPRGADQVNAANEDAQGKDGGETVNGEIVASASSGEAISTETTLLNGDVHINGDSLDTTQAVHTDAASGLKIDLDPPRQLQPTPAMNGVKTGDPEKKKTDTRINGEVQIPGENSTENGVTEQGQLHPSKDKSENNTAVNGANDSAERADEDDDTNDADGDAEGDADADGDPDQEGEADQNREQNGMLSPESLPIAAH